MRRLIGAPKIAQLNVDVWMRGVVKAFRIVHAFLVPAFDFVRNHGCFVQGTPADQRTELCRGGRARQSSVRNRPDDLMAEWTVSSQRRRRYDDKKNCHEQDLARRASHL